MKKKFTTTLEEETIKKLKIEAIEKTTSAGNIIDELVKKNIKKNLK